MTPAQTAPWPERALLSFASMVHRVGGLVLAVMMVITAVDVILRYLFNSPIKGSVEINELLLVLVVFLSMGELAVGKGNVRVELVTSNFSKNIQLAFGALANLVVLCLGVLITWRSFVLALTKLEKGETTTVLFLPVYPVVFLLAFAMAVFSLVMLVELKNDIKQIARSAWSKPEKRGLIIAGVVIVICVILGASFWPEESFSSSTTGLLSMAALIILLFSGIPIGYVMALIGVLGMTYMTGLPGGLNLLGNVPWGTGNTYTYAVIPLFILMGGFAFYNGMGQDIYNLVNKWLGFLPGGLAMATIGGCAGFAAICGSSVATAATMGMVALPEMKRYNYDMGLGTGCLAAGGAIGILIPPSMPLIIYGILTNVPISDLFIAGIFPGLTQALFYIITIYISCKLDPRKGPPGPRFSSREKVGALKDAWGILFLFFLVIGGLYFGVFTPTEAAGVGAFAAFILTWIKGKLSWYTLKGSFGESGTTTAMIFTILIGAMILGYFLTLTQLPFHLADFVGGLNVNRYVIVILILIVYILLGCVMDALSIMLLTVPIFFPVVQNLEFNLIWFGILVVRVSEMGLITPPVGMNVFVIKGVAKDVPMYTIFRGVMPFVITDLFHVALLVAIPQISLILLS